MKRITIDPQTDQRWDRLIQTQPSSIFHSPEWIRVLTNTYDFDVQANILIDDRVDADNEETTPLGGLPFCNLDDIRGHRVSSLPFCDYTDPLVQTVDEWNHLVEPLAEGHSTYRIRPLHNTIPLGDERFQRTNQARWHGLDVSPSIDELWTGLYGSVRTSIRKASKHGVTVRRATDESELAAFFRLHVGIRKHKYRMVAQPYQFFQNIWKELIANGDGDLLLAIYKGQIVAATIFLYWKDTLYYKFNASEPDMLWLNPNETLLWEGIRRGKEHGCQFLDFGLSDWDQAGLISYKRKFSGMEKTIYFLQTLPESPCELDGEKGMKQMDIGLLLPKLTALFTDESVPQEITQDAGALLYRYFA